MANYFTDRVVQYPGRVTMVPVQGEANTYDMSRAEGTVTTEGTPFNAAIFNSIADDIIQEADDNIITDAELAQIATTLGTTPAKLSNILSAMINEARNEIKYQEFSKSGVAISAGGWVEVVVPVTIPTGYEIMTTGRFRTSGTGATSIYWAQIFWANDGVHCVLRSTGTGAANVQVIIGVIFKKTHS